MKTFPCAKINLGLYVTERRADGYHNLETVFYPIPLCDELDIETADNDQLLLEGIPVAGTPEQNLVTRTVRLLREKGFDIPPVQIKLRKRIPSGAGLGGGSSDAAYTMTMLNEMFQLGLSSEVMEQYVASLGADCAFFVRHRPVLAHGIGNQFTPISLSLDGWHLLLVKPDDFISTREAYQGVCPQQPPYPLAESIMHPIEEWQNLIVNDFEQSVFPQHPIIARIRQMLLDAGASYAAMSGSGSSVFGLFRQEPDIQTTGLFTQHFTFVAEL